MVHSFLHFSLCALVELIWYCQSIGRLLLKMVFDTGTVCSRILFIKNTNVLA